MKKIAIIMIVSIMVLSGLNVNALDNYSEKNLEIKSCHEEITFKEIKINEKNDLLSIDLDDTDEYIMQSGKPKLPVFIKTYTFPMNTKIKNVEIEVLDSEETTISHKIKPANMPVPKIKIDNKVEIFDNNAIFDKSVYESSELFPKKPFSYKINCGLKDNENVIFLNVYYYPVRYSPKEDRIICGKEVSIKVSYTEKDFKTNYEDEYDMVIITSNSFKDLVQPLITHKNSIGVKTFLKTTSQIYDDYEGRDNQEKIKYFIKDAKEIHNISYVLLVGGRVGQLLNFWHVPARYSGIYDGFSPFVTDLYYSDIYKYDEVSDKYVFDDWDSNGNDVFAEYGSGGDVLDLYPDVSVGRLACRNKKEVGLVVDKIINYEKNTYGKDWFKNFIIVGGDTIPPASGHGVQYGIYEGEVETDVAFSILKQLGFNKTELWASTGNLTGPSDVIRELSKGAGFFFLSGHGNPMSYATHPADAEEDGQWIDGLYNFDMKHLQNKDKYPVCIIGACHSNQFDVCNMNFFKGIIEQGLDFFDNEHVGYDSGGFYKLEWVKRCWGWNLVVQEEGGSIATLGNAGLGFGDEGYETLLRNDGWITTNFFDNYVNLTLNLGHGNFSLGDIHSKTITEYITYVHSVYIEDEPWNYMDSETVQGWTILGDPSLKIGGVKPS